MKNKILYVLLIIPLFFISGCSTSLNLNEKLIIKGVGIDSCDQGFELSFNIVKSGNFAGAKEEDSNKVIILKSNPYNAEFIKEEVSKYIELNELGFGAVANALRLALVGSSVGPDLFAIIETIGAKSCSDRITYACQNIQV